MDVYENTRVEDAKTAERRDKESKQKQERRNMPKETTEILNVWFKANLHRPYPTEDEKQDLMRQTGLQMNQISNWFINARRRQLPAMINKARAEHAARSNTGFSTITASGAAAESNDDRDWELSEMQRQSIEEVVSPHGYEFDALVLRIKQDDHLQLHLNDSLNPNMLSKAIAEFVQREIDEAIRALPESDNHNPKPPREGWGQFMKRKGRELWMEMKVRFVTLMLIYLLYNSWRAGVFLLGLKDVEYPIFFLDWDYQHIEYLVMPLALALYVVWYSTFSPGQTAAINDSVEV